MYKKLESSAIELENKNEELQATNEKLTAINKILKKKEERLRKSEKKYRNLFNSVPMGLFWTRPSDGKLLECNDNFAKIHGYANRKECLEGFIGSELYIDPAVRSRMLKEIKERGEVNNIEAQLKRKDGLPYWVSYSARFYPERDIIEGGTFDITGHKQMEEKLRESEERYSLLFENSGSAITFFDTEAKYVLLNKQSAKNLKREAKDFIDKSIYDMFPKGIAEFHFQRFSKIIKEGKGAIFEDSIDLPKGKLWFSSNIQPVKDVSGNIKGVQVISTDITERKKTEEALAESEKKYKSIVENINEALFIHDFKGKIFDINENACELFDYERDKIIGKNIRTFTTKDSIKKVAPHMKQLSKNKSLIFDSYAQKSDGSIIPINLSVTVVSRDGEGVIHSFVKDITERKNVEKEKEKLLHDLNERIKEINGLYSLGKLSEQIENIEDIFNKFIRDVVPPSMQFPDKTFAKIELDGKKYCNYGKNELCDSIFCLTAPIIVKEKQRGILTAGYIEDMPFIEKFEQKLINGYAERLGRIIERKESEEEVRKIKERLRSFMESSPDIFALLDSELNYVEVNKTGLKYLKKTKEEIIGKNILDIIPALKKTDRYNKYMEVINTGKPFFMDGFIPDPRFRDIHLSVRSFKVGNGLGIIVTDTTERKKAEKELRIAKEKAEESDKLKTAFLANMSHEIRTPMNVIIGFGELLKNPNLTAEKRKLYINWINSNSKHLLRVIDDIVDISKIEANQLKIEPEEFSLNGLLTELFINYQREIKLIRKSNIQLCIEKAFDDFRNYIYADETRLAQVLSNLINNALKFTEKGYIEFGYMLENKNTLKFYVKDTGMGILKEQQEIIFERFRQAEIDHIKTYSGTGLGLTISKRLIELMGGKIWIESKFQQGSTFYFTIPYQPVKKYKEIDEKESKAYNWKGKKILIVEDDLASFQILEAIMHELQIQIIQTDDGEKAVEICKADKDINLVIMDIKLPVMNGYEATRQIRKFRKDLPVIAQTSYAMKEDKKKCIQAGCNDYISKPIDINILITKMDKYLREE